MTDCKLTAQAARQELYEIIRRDTSFEQKAQEALDLGKQYLGVENGHLTRIDRKTDHWEVVISTDPDGGPFPAGLKLDLGATYCRRTIEENAPITLYDAPTQGWEDDPAYETHGLHCYHGATLILDSEPYGTICFVAADPRREQFSAAETMFVELATRLLERELEREQHEAQLTRQANLTTVLNRVLRHNLRNDMSVVRGYMQLMADKLGADSTSGTVLDRIDNLIALSQKARELDRIVVANYDRESTNIVALVEGVIETVASEYPTASISVEYDEEGSAAVFPSFERAIRELLVNAAKHGSKNPTVTVTIETVPNAVEIRIADDGSGLADHEINVLKTGAETPLTHGSGLGLWLAHWIVTSHDGSVDATATEEGTTMTITVPRKPVTDVRQQLSKLTRARDQYQAAFEEAYDAMVIIDDDARIVDANTEAASIYGLDKQQLFGRAIPDFLPDDFDFESAWGEFQNLGHTRETVTVVGADGVERPVEYSATMDIVPGQHLVVSRDLTGRNDREQLFQAVFEEVSDAIVIANGEGEYTAVNPAACELFGLEESDLLGRRIEEFAPPDFDIEAAWETFQASERERDTFPLVRESGERRTVEYAAAKDITTDKHLSVLRDITERSEREHEREQYRTLVETVGDPMYILGPDARVQVINEAGLDHWGYTREEVIGKHASEFMPEEDFERGTALIVELLNDDNRRWDSFEMRSITAAGEVIVTENNVAVLTDDGEFVGSVGVIRDITERKQFEQELQLNNDRLDEFASVVSHDLRNPLAVAQGYLDLSQQECESEHLEKVDNALGRMDTLISDLLTIARQRETDADQVPNGLSAVFEDCWETVDSRDATLAITTDAVIRADRSRLQQLLENLLRNAIEHAGKEVTITAGALENGFFVEDDGPGIPIDTREQVFEHGYSTTHEGTGFGLSIVQQIVEEHGWEVTVSERAGGGSRFEFTGVTVDPT